MANTEVALRFGPNWKSAAELKLSYEETLFPPLEIKELQPILTSGIRRGSIAEVHGVRSAGCTSLCLRILAEATARGEICAVVDLQDNFHPASAAEAGVVLKRLVWVRCGGNLDAAMRASDLLLHAGGFGLIYLDLCEANPKSLNKIPLSYWHRFRQAVEHTPSILLISSHTPQAKSCASLSLQLKMAAVAWSGKDPFCVLRGVKNAVTPGGRITPLRPHLLFLKAA
jgi:hypothetical protein